MKINSAWKSAAACSIVLLILLIWKVSYPFTCFAWLFPFLIFVSIAYGQFEYLVQYRKCQAGCSFNQTSWIYAWITRKPLIFMYSIIIAIPFTLSLISFTALASITDGIFILVASIITLFLYPIAFNFFQKHVAKDMLGIVSKRFVVAFNMFVMLILYSYISYQYIPVPSYLDMTSIKSTLDGASQSVASLCSISNLFLKWSQELNAASWFGIVIGAKEIENKNMLQFIWIIFFINHALVFAGLSRSQVEVINIIKK